jgi:cytochrome c556
MQKKGYTKLPILVITLTLALLCGCGASAQEAPPDEIKTRQIAVILDSTSSTNMSFAEEVRSELAARVEAWVPPKPTDPKAGVQGVDGLFITVFLVDENPNAYGKAHKAMEEIPKVRPLAPAPAIPRNGATEAYIEAYQDWKDLAAEWTAAYEQALADARAAADKVKALNLASVNDGEPASGIGNSVTAILQTLSPDKDVLLIIASDLLENVNNTGLAPDGIGGSAVIILAVPDGDVAGATERVKSFTSLLESFGFSSVEVFHADRARAVIQSAFMRR